MDLTPTVVPGLSSLSTPRDGGLGTLQTKTSEEEEDNTESVKEEPRAKKEKKKKRDSDAKEEDAVRVFTYS